MRPSRRSKRMTWTCVRSDACSRSSGRKLRFRAAIGRSTDCVDLLLLGRLMSEPDDAPARRQRRPGHDCGGGGRARDANRKTAADGCVRFREKKETNADHSTPAQEVKEVAAGRADWVSDAIPGPLLASLHRCFTARLQTHPATETDCFQLNTTRPPFNDLRVRRALNLALDRGAISAAYGGPVAATPTCQILPPESRATAATAPGHTGRNSASHGVSPISPALARSLPHRIPGAAQVLRRSTLDRRVAGHKRRQLLPHLAHLPKRLQPRLVLRPPHRRCNHSRPNETGDRSARSRGPVGSHRPRPNQLRSLGPPRQHPPNRLHLRASRELPAPPLPRPDRRPTLVALTP